MNILRILIGLYDRSHHPKERAEIIKLIKFHMEREIENESN
jgi:hypothetical protein